MREAEIIIEAIKKRRSIRKYKNEKIPKSLLEKILNAGQWAPSAHNLQPWKFLVIQDAFKIKEISTIMLKKCVNLFAGFNIVMKESAKCVQNAPCIILVYSTGEILKKFAQLGKSYKKIADLYETQSASFAIENMMLCAHAVKLGSVCHGIALFAAEEINNYLGQKRGTLIELISLGYPNENITSSKRKSLNEIVEFL